MWLGVGLRARCVVEGVGWGGTQGKGEGHGGEDGGVGEGLRL